MSKKNLCIPFDPEGNLLGYSYYGIASNDEIKCMNEGKFEYYSERNGVSTLREVFKPNFKFSDELIFNRFSRGCSSVKAHFTSSNTNKKYEMFITDFQDVILADKFNDHKISGTFTFIKRGLNYGIILTKE